MIKENSKKKKKKNFENVKQIEVESYKDMSTSQDSLSKSFELSIETENKENKANSNPSELGIIVDEKKGKTSKKNNGLKSKQNIENQIKDNNIFAEKDKLKIIRNCINFIVCNYFNYAEDIINNLNLSSDYKKNLNKSLTQFKEIIKNNSCSYKIGFMISSNDIKNKIMKILIEKAIKNSNGCLDSYDFYNKLFQNLPKQFYSFEQRLESLKALLKNKFGENEITKKLDDISTKTGNLTNPWEEKEMTSISTVSKNLQIDLLSTKRKSIFLISKDYTERIRQREMTNNSNTDLNLQESQLSFDSYESFETDVSAFSFDNFEYNLLNSPLSTNFNLDIPSTCENSTNEENFSILRLEDN